MLTQGVPVGGLSIDRQIASSNILQFHPQPNGPAMAAEKGLGTLAAEDLRRMDHIAVIPQKYLRSRVGLNVDTGLDTQASGLSSPATVR